jgi:hypothetical protein
MDEGFEVQNVRLLTGEDPKTGLPGVWWAKGGPVPIPGAPASSKIEKIVLDGDIVDIFFRVGDVTGSRARFSPPVVLMTTEVAPRDVWEEQMSSDDGDQFGELMDRDANHWQRDKPIPGGGSTIVKILSDEFSTTRVYALPDAASRWGKANYAFVFTFFPLSGVTLLDEGLTLSAWSEIMAEVEARANDVGDPDDDQDDDDDTDVPDAPDSQSQLIAQPQPMGVVQSLPAPPMPPIQAAVPPPAPNFMPTEPPELVEAPTTTS